ncbi:MAG: methyltransferase [Planctomycetota bacterium]|nr:methyltransferase [Planctomycetota bacterium]
MNNKVHKRRLILDTRAQIEKSQQTFLFDRRVEIISKRRLRKVDILLLEELPDLSGKKVLCGYGSKGIVALAIQAAYPDADVHSMEFDAPTVMTIEEWKIDNEMEQPEVQLVAELGDMGKDFDVVLMPCPQNTSRTLLAEFFEQARHALKLKGQLYAATEAHKDDWLRQLIKKEFGVQGTRLTMKRRHGFVWKAVKKKAGNKSPANRQRQHNFNVPERETLSFHTRPGLASHDNVSEETVALMDTLAPSLGEREGILNIGCGAGLLGLFLSAVAPEASVMLIDESARAVELCERNRINNSIENAHVLLDTPEIQGMYEESSSLVIVQNIDSDRAFGERALSKALSAVTPGGRLCFATREAPIWGALLKDDWQDIETERCRKLIVFHARKKPSCE